MNVACPECHTRYSVEDGRIPPSGVTIRCPKCTHSFVVKRDAAPPLDAGATLTPNPPPPSGPENPAARDPGIPPSKGRSAPPPDATTDPTIGMSSGRGKPLAESNMLNFIEQTAQRAGVARAGVATAEFRVRNSNGMIDGPHGFARLLTMLRNGDLLGNEEISEDGRTWRPLTAHHELARALAAARGEASPSDGNFSDLPAPASPHRDLPAPAGPRDLPRPVQSRDLPRPAQSRDLPIPAGPSDLPIPAAQQDRARERRDLPGLADPARQRHGFGDGFGAELSNLSLTGDAADLGGPPPSGAPAPDLFNTHPSNGVSAKPDPALGFSMGDPLDPGALELGEIPQLPSIWEQYRTPILVFAGVMVIAAIGLGTALSDYGPFGSKWVAKKFEQPPPPPPEAPPPPPVKIADATEIRALVDEHSFEAFRSVLATVKRLGTHVPDNMLIYAKATGLATLAYGKEAFPVEELRSAVEALNTLDLTKTLGGNPTLANLEILKARSALEIASGAAATAADQLGGAFEQNAEDKEIAYLLGVARWKAGDDFGALRALDRAIVVDTGYAPALHTIGEIIAKNKELGAPADAAWWFEKAFTEEPTHARSGVAAAEIYRGLRLPGAERRALAAAADGAERGLPPEERAKANYLAALAFQQADRPKESAKYGREAARLAPAENGYAAAAAISIVDGGKAKEALELLQPVLQRAPADIATLLASAQAYMALNDIPKAFEMVEAAKKVQPRNALIYYWEGAINQQLQKIDHARTAFRQAVQLSRSADPRPMIRLGRLELALGNIDGALDWAQQGFKADPSRPQTQTLMGDCYRIRGQFEEAMAAYRGALALDPEELDARIGNANTLRDTAARSRSPAEATELAHAVPIYLEALREYPTDARVIFEYGRALEMQNKLDAALQLYRDAAAIDEKDPRPHLAIVSAYLDKPAPDLSLAKASLDKAVALAPNSHDVRFWVARVAFEEGKSEEALRHMKKAVEAAPENALFRYWHGRILEKGEQLYEAIAEWESATTLNSRLAPAWRALAGAAVSLHKYQKAEEYFEKYREAARDDRTIWLDIGQMYVRQNKTDLAKNAFGEVLKAQAKSAAALVGLGRIEAQGGDEKKALEHFQRAVAADASDAEALCEYANTAAAIQRSTRRSVDRGVTEKLRSCLAHPGAPDELKAAVQEHLDATSVN